MQIIKVRFLKEDKPIGKEYTYYSPVTVKPGDIVQINSNAKGVVVEADVPEAEIEAYRDKVKTIVGLVEEKKNPMTTKELADLLDGREYGNEITISEAKDAAEAGLVVVFGASDDLIEFRGAINDEGGCFDGGTVYFDRDGVAQEGEEKEFSIEAIWCGQNDYSWSYEADFPHNSFAILEDGEPYCRGVVFSLNDLKPQGKYSAEKKRKYFNIIRGVTVTSYLTQELKTEVLEFISHMEEVTLHE